MQPPALSDPPPETRSAVRSNMFLAAVLKGPAFSVPVRIRNMSSTGALVEGAAAPDGGSLVRLIRGQLMIPAEVAWSAEGRCGLRFSSLVSIREWLAPPSNREQKRVDDTIRVLKAGAIPLPLGSEPHDSTSPVELGIDLRAAAKLLEAHCEDVLGDPQALARYGDRLQNLDIVLQTIGAVAEMLAGDGDEHSAVSRLQNLRVSARQALQRDG
jgi:hypothetical protein